MAKYHEQNNRKRASNYVIRNLEKNENIEVAC